MNKEILLERGSYYKVERFGKEKLRFLVLENDWMWVYFDPKGNKTDEKRFLIKTTKVYDTNGKHYDIIPHFWLAKDGRGYYKPVPNGGFHIVPSQNHLVIDWEGVEVSHRNNFGDRNFLFVVHKQGTRKHKDCMEFDYPQTLTKIC